MFQVDNTKRREEQLVKQMINGSTFALEELFLLYYQPVYTTVYSILKSKLDAEAVVEETFIAIWQNKHRHNTAQSFAQFVLQTANKCLVVYTRDIVNKKMNEFKIA